jgi:hypothetical protein
MVQSPSPAQQHNVLDKKEYHHGDGQKIKKSWALDALENQKAFGSKNNPKAQNNCSNDVVGIMNQENSFNKQYNAGCCGDSITKKAIMFPKTKLK